MTVSKSYINAANIIKKETLQFVRPLLLNITIKFFILQRQQLHDDYMN